MVSFNSVPTALRVPFVAVEIDSSRAARGPGPMPYRALLIGQKLGYAPAAANSLHRVTSADEVAELAGRGSMLHRQALAWFAFNKSTEVYIGVLSDSASGVIAEGTITFTGTATAAGTISFYVGGQLVQVAVAVGDTAATIAAALATEIGKHATGTITCASADAADNVTIGGTLDGVAVTVQFVGTAGAVVLGAATYSIDTGNTEAAASLAAQINAHAVASRLVRATSSSGVVTLRAVQEGTAGNAITLSTTDAVDLAVSGATLTGGVSGENPDLAMHAVYPGSGGAVTLKANNAGAVGNEFDLRLNYRSDSEALPAGITAAIVQPTSGATNPSLTTLISTMGDQQFHIIAHPYTDSTSLTSLETELTSRFGPIRQIEGVAITAKDDTLSACSTLGDSRNSPHSCIVRTNDSPTPAAEFAAHVAGVAAYYGQIDPARPFQTLPLPYVLAPAETDRDTREERNLSLYDGISTTVTNAGDVVQIERLITTSQRNAAGSPDTAYLDVTTMLSLMYARDNFRTRMATKYPRHKLGGDSDRYPAGEAIMTPSLGKAEAVSWFKDMSESSPVVFDPSALEQFKDDLVVEINAGNPNRLDFLLPPDLIGQLINSAAQIQFRT
jgi:phage tail sheath gpL-like